MEFCKECDNMLYLDISNTDDSKSVLVYNCKKCNKQYSNIEIKNNCVYKMDYNIDKIKRDSLVNKYTSLDITLPRINNIKCPNPKCTLKNPEIVYLKYDDSEMKYCYICCECQKNDREFYWFLD